MSPDTCRVKWCEEADEHLGMHRGYLIVLTNRRRESVGLCLVGAGSTPYLAVSVGNGDAVEVVLDDWDQADQLNNGMFVAITRHAT